MDYDKTVRTFEIRYLRRRKVVASEMFKGTGGEASAVAKAKMPSYKADNATVIDVESVQYLREAEMNRKSNANRT